MCFGPYRATLVMTPFLEKISPYGKSCLWISSSVPNCVLTILSNVFERRSQKLSPNRKSCFWISKPVPNCVLNHFQPLWLWPKILKNYPQIEKSCFWISKSLPKCLLDHFDQFCFCPQILKIILKSKNLLLNI